MTRTALSTLEKKKKKVLQTLEINAGTFFGIVLLVLPLMHR